MKNRKKVLFIIVGIVVYFLVKNIATQYAQKYTKTPQKIEVKP